MATLPLGRSVIGVCVGVNRPGLLPPLTAAASGARRFHDWLLRQRDHGVAVESTLITDEEADAVVTRAAVLTAVKAALKRSGDVLFLYLAGHGIAHSAYEEKLLLSSVLDDDAEAINLLVVRERSKRCSIPHVIVIYDACRTYANTERLRQVAGGPVFPLDADRRGAGHVDFFYACAPDESSFEVAENSGAHPNNFKAFFTESLLAALERPTPDLIENLDLSAGQSVTVIPCARLELMLERDVPRRAAESTPAFDQSPDIDVLSHMPAEFFAVVPAPAVAAPHLDDLASVLFDRLSLEPGPSTVAPPSKAQMVRWHATRAFTPSHGREAPPAALDSIARSTGFARVIEAVRKTKGRWGFETHCGFTVIGDSVRRIDVSNNPAAEFLANDSPSGERHYRIGKQAWDARGGTALIEFRNGSGVALPILPGYIGALLVEDGQLQALTYTLSKGTREYAQYEARREEVDQRRAVAIGSASIGQLAELGRTIGAALPDYIRVDKALDPCLGVLAAHAYHLIGDEEQLNSVWRWMSAAELWSVDMRSRVRVPVPFDVAMLAGRLDAAHAIRAPGIAPCCPWLSIGWAQLAAADIVLHPAISQAGRHRQPGTWTTFSADGIGVLREALLAEEIR